MLLSSGAKSTGRVKMAKKKDCKEEVMEAIDHTMTKLREEHEKTIDELHNVWRHERHKYREEISTLKEEIGERNDLISKMARHMGRGKPWQRP